MQKIKRDDLVSLLKVSDCITWKEVIKDYLRICPYETGSFEIKILDKDLELLEREGSKEQKEAVAKLGIVLNEDKNAFIRELEIDELRELSLSLFGDIDTLQPGDGACLSINRKDLLLRSFYVKSNYEVILHKEEIWGGTVIEIKKK